MCYLKYFYIKCFYIINGLSVSLMDKSDSISANSNAFAMSLVNTHAVDGITAVSNNVAISVGVRHIRHGSSSDLGKGGWRVVEGGFSRWFNNIVGW